MNIKRLSVATRSDSVVRIAAVALVTTIVTAQQRIEVFRLQANQVDAQIRRSQSR